MKVDDKNNEIVWERIKKIVDEIQHGSVTIIIQDGIIVQVDNTEKIRFK